MRPVFGSVFAGELNNYLEYRHNSGIKSMEVDYNECRKLDAFFEREQFGSIHFTQEEADRWKEPLSGESPIGRYKRINITRRFFEYLAVKGYPVVVFRDIREPKTTFVPHIYTEEEVERYFQAVDSYEPPKAKKNRIMFPVLYRLLYCCGTRIGETLSIRKKDVDLVNGVIKLSETKNSRERYVVMSESMLALMRDYADKTFYLLSDTDFIFSKRNGEQLTKSYIYKHHVDILRQAGIPYRAGGQGPRIHDWRHTFAVNAFKQMIDNGMDMYVSLPILSAYLGHISIEATERYVRLTVAMYPYIEEKFNSSLDKVFKEISL